MSELVLTGLDGSNPLGFLAGLGILQAVAERHAQARLAWRDDGVWRPVLLGVELDRANLLALLTADQVACANDPAFGLEYEGTHDLKPPPGIFRAYLAKLVEAASCAQRRSIDWAAAFATDIAVDNNGNTKPTALHFTAGKQLWLRMVLDLAVQVTVDDLAEAAFGPWRYDRPLPVLAWDSTASRDYALRASNPAHEKKTGVPGADWLAVRGLSFISVVPRRTRVLTTGCSGEWKTGRFTWPLWDVPLGSPLIATTMRLPGLEDMADGERRARGIGVVFQSGIHRSDQGGYGGFTPAAVV